jgi:hypothetical protein
MHYTNYGIYFLCSGREMHSGPEKPLPLLTPAWKLRKEKGGAMDFAKNRHNHQSLKFIERDQAIESYNNCSLCGEALEFTYEMSEERESVAEQAYCPHCHIRTKAHQFVLN